MSGSTKHVIEPKKKLNSTVDIHTDESILEELRDQCALISKQIEAARLKSQEQSYEIDALSQLLAHLRAEYLELKKKAEDS